MTLFEAMRNKEYLGKKIAGYKDYLKQNLDRNYSHLNDTLEEIYTLVDNHQRYVTSIRKCVETNTIDVGDVKIVDAKCIRDGLEYKLNLLDELISICSSGDSDHNFDIASLMTKRDTLFAELTTIEHAILKAEILTELV